MVENICIAAKGLGLGTCIVGSAGALFDDADKGAYWRGEIDIPVDLQYMIGVAIGVPDEVPLREDMFCKGCTNPYGWTKYMIEKILQGIVTADPEWSVVLLRYFNPIGAHESGRMGENPNGIPNNLMPYITKVAAGQLDHLTVFGNDYNTPDGTGVRDYIHAAWDYAAKHNGCEIINLGTGVGYSVLDIVNTFSRVNQVPVPYVIGPRRDGDVDACYADPTKAKELLGWTATKTLEDMCRDSWRWQKANPNGYQDK